MASGEQRPQFSVVDDQEYGFGLFFSMEIMDQFDVANHSSPTSRFGNDRFPSYPHLLIQKAKDDPIEP